MKATKMNQLKIVIRIGVQAILLILVVQFFGLESWNRFQAKKAVITSSEQNKGRVPAPAVTVCGFDQGQNWAFKKKPPGLNEFSQDIIGHVCPNMKGDDIVKCVEEETYNLTTMVKVVTKGIQDNSSMPGSWYPELSMTGAALCHTLETDMNLGTNFTTESLRIELNKNLGYYVIIHDPDYFLINLNPGLPFKVLSILESKMTMHQLIVVKHENLDVPSKPCNPDPSYRFTGCIKEVFSREVGCRLPWDRWTGQATPVCHHLDQYR